jgi:hypothetical protein
MKTTHAFIDTIKPESLEKRRNNSSAYYKDNKDRLVIKNKIAYYKKKYGCDIVNEYVSRYGDEAVVKIRENIKTTLVAVNTAPIDTTPHSIITTTIIEPSAPQQRVMYGT